jgi:hypothetical protein
MERPNQFVQRFKSKYLLAEVLSYAFYCHKGQMMFAYLCKDSRQLLSDEYIIRCFKKKKREFYVTTTDGAKTLRNGLNGTYLYTLCTMERLIIEFLNSFEHSLKLNPKNLPFEIEKI